MTIRAAAFLLGLVLVALPAVAAEQGRVIVLELEGAAGEGKPLKVHLDAVSEEVRAAFATGYNAVVHDGDASDLKRSGDAVAGTVKITVHPDNYLPKDGNPVACAFQIEARIAGDEVKGTYEGTWGGEARRGVVGGTVSTRPDYARPFGLKARLLGALHRLYMARGSSWKYALDMNLIARVKDGRCVRPRFETIVPDYRRYSAIVEACDLAVRGNDFAGTFTARVDYGGQGDKHAPAPVELHRYTLRGRVIGDVVGGTYDVTVGEEHRGEGLRFAGTLDFGPPPDPTRSLATLRLHDAMKEGPVLLSLSLADDGLVNGLAYASGYNHQPHDLDASGLRLDGRRLRGKVVVSIVPDCYKPPERFDLPYEIDAAIVDDAVTGTFTGEDRGRKVEGTVTGSLRPKREPVVPPKREDLAEVTLELGYSLVKGAAPKREAHAVNHAHVRFALAGGKVTEVVVHNPHDRTIFDAKVTDSDLRLDGDRLTGSVAFDLESDAVQGGRYVFRFEAIVDGDRLLGFWRGTHEGRDILTKSAKLGGQVR